MAAVDGPVVPLFKSPLNEAVGEDRREEPTMVGPHEEARSSKGPTAKRVMRVLWCGAAQAAPSWRGCQIPLARAGLSPGSTAGRLLPLLDATLQRLVDLLEQDQRSTDTFNHARSSCVRSSVRSPSDPAPAPNLEAPGAEASRLATPLRSYAAPHDLLSDRASVMQMRRGYVCWCGSGNASKTVDPSPGYATPLFRKEA